MVQGIYHPDKEIGPERSTLIIKKDYTFSFTNFSDILETRTSVGRWNVKDNLLFLRKDSLRILDTFIKVIEKLGNIDSKVIIRVVDAADNKPVAGAEIRVNEEQRYYTIDTTGIANIDSVVFLRSLYFSYASIQEKIYINNQYAKDVTLIVNFNNLPVVGQPVIPKTWVIKKNKLIPFRGGGLFKSSNNVYIKNEVN